MNTFNLLLLVLVVWVSAYAVYFNLVRPVILVRLKFWINEVEDELNLSILAGRSSQDDGAVAILRTRVVKAAHWLEHINLTSMLMESTREDSMLPKSQVEQENRAIEESSGELKAFSRRLDLAVIGAFCANSPFLVGVVVMFLLGVALFSTMGAGLRYALTRMSWIAIYFGDKTNNQRAVAAC